MWIQCIFYSIKYDGGFVRRKHITIWAIVLFSCQWYDDAVRISGTNPFALHGTESFFVFFFCPRLWSVPFGQPTSQQPACLCFLCVTLIYECSMLRRKEFTVYAINIHDLGLWSIILGMVRRVSIDNKKHSLPSCLLCRKNRNTFCRNIAFHCQCNGRNRRKWPK